MKDSGVEWIGEIPEAWGNTKCKYVALFSPSCDFSSLFEGDNINFAPMENIGNGYFTKATIPYSRKLGSYTSYEEGDIVLAKVTPCFENGNIAIMQGLDSGCGVGSSELFVIRPCGVFRDYLFYYLRQGSFLKYAQSTMTGTGGLKRVSSKFIPNAFLPLPCPEEQVRIAAYLDTQTAEIDASIAKTQESIEEYKKLKQAVITQAVTKGIRPGRAMKDSGVEWIGEIPEDWSSIPLRHIGFCQNGISKSGEAFGTGYPFVTYGDTYNNMSLPAVPSGLVQSSEEERRLYSVEVGDILFTRTSETIEEIGFSSVCITPIPDATFAGFLIRVRPVDKRLDHHFSQYYFRSDIHRRFFVKEMNIVTRASLGQGLLKRLPVLLPCKKEQQEIAVYLDEKCAAIDTLIEKKQAIITELEAYKKSLIYEYVTGKKEVPVASC